MPPSKSTSFASDDAGAVARLVEACAQARHVSHAPVVERSLVPFFDLISEELAAQEVQRKFVSHSGRGNNRSGSPVFVGGDIAKGGRSSRVAKGSPPSNGQVQMSARRSHTGVVSIGPQPGNLAACPAIFSSPKPSDLPMPSTALLRRFSHTGASLVSVMAPPMAPLVLPMMVSAA